MNLAVAVLNIDETVVERVYCTVSEGKIAFLLTALKNHHWWLSVELAEANFGELLSTVTIFSTLLER